LFGINSNIFHYRDRNIENTLALSATAIISAFPSPSPDPTPTPIPPPQKLENPPEIAKAVYVTGYSAGSKKYLDYLSNLFKNTEINAVVVNIKEDDGHISYNSGAEEVKKYKLYNGAIKDIDALIRFFHGKNIYVIGRMVVFQDPTYSKIRPDLAIYSKASLTQSLTYSGPTLWKNNKGLTWLDPTATGAWDYNISIAKDALLHGFDEINFDYIRFPSDGNVKDAGFHFWGAESTKAGVLKNFFEYTRKELAGEKISVDLFGQTTTNTDDMGIGQVIENAFENFDYISPMVYPSHYINGFLGFDNPSEHPYEIVKYSMATALNRENVFLKKIEDAISKSYQPVESSSLDLQAPLFTPTPPLSPSVVLAKFRPWLQDFNMGAVYNSEMVKAEIRATKDALGENYAGYMLWNASNIYTQGAVLKNAGN